MSGVKRTDDFHSVKTRGLVIQNSDNSFPLQGSVMAAADSRGHMIASRDININSIAINNDRVLIDGSGNITANSIILDSSGVAIETIGDIRSIGSNIYTSGDQNATGFVQTTYVTLMDPSANDPHTYLFANGGNLFWQNDTLTQNYNISQGFQSMAVDPNNRNFVLLTGNDDPSLYYQLNNLLKIFSNAGVFLSLRDASDNIPPSPPSVNTLNAYNVIFNSKSGMIIRFIDASGNAKLNIGDFVFYGNANSGSSQYTVLNLCANLSNTTNTQGSRLDTYITFTYNASTDPYSVIMTRQPIPGIFPVFLDIDRVGEAKRFMNHLYITDRTVSYGGNPPTPSNFPFGPPTSTQLTIPPLSPPQPLGIPTNVPQYLPYAISGKITGLPFVNLLKYPNNDPPLASPFYDISVNTATLTIYIDISGLPDLTGLSPVNQNQPGSGNTLQSYGVYLNGEPIWLEPAIQPLPPGGQKFAVTYNGAFVLPTNTVIVSSIDVYNETVRPTVKTF
jgi:hypothetical protein